MTAQVEAVRGDITREQVDAIVNAANSSLMGGGGVDAAIHAAAGPTLLAECRELRSTHWPRGLPVGGAVVTGAGDLPCRWVVHTVGPNWHAGERDSGDLARCFTASLAEAARVGAASVAFPAISAGIYGWDARVVAETAVDAVRTALAVGRATDGAGDEQDLSGIGLVRFVAFNDALLGQFERALRAPR